MVWIKRNFLLVIGGLVALILIGLGSYLVMSGLARNKQLIEDVEATKSRAGQLYDANPFPSQTNIAAAKREIQLLHDAITRAHKRFTPVPVAKMDVKQFMVYRDESLSELREAAKKSGTELPASDYSFSFATQRSRTQFSPDTLPRVAEQMGEVKALCTLLFEARVNKIGNVRRARGSKDDKDNNGNGSDYTDSRLEVVTDSSGQMISSPYELTFFSFSAEVADVLNRLERSPHGFLVKAIQVEPEDSRMSDAVSPTGTPGNNNPPPTLPNRAFAQPRFPANTNRVPVNPVPPRPAASDKPVHLLKEKRLKATLLIYTLRPAK
jgi:hypothetical protein